MMYTATLDARRIGSTGDYSHVVVSFDAPGPHRSLATAARLEAEANGFETLAVKSITPIVPDQPRRGRDQS